MTQLLFFQFYGRIFTDYYYDTVITILIAFWIIFIIKKYDSSSVHNF